MEIGCVYRLSRVTEKVELLSVDIAVQGQIPRRLRLEMYTLSMQNVFSKGLCILHLVGRNHSHVDNLHVTYILGRNTFGNNVTILIRGFASLFQEHQRTHNVNVYKVYIIYKMNPLTN